MQLLATDRDYVLREARRIAAQAGQQHRTWPGSPDDDAEDEDLEREDADLEPGDLDDEELDDDELDEDLGATETAAGEPAAGSAPPAGDGRNVNP